MERRTRPADGPVVDAGGARVGGPAAGAERQPQLPRRIGRIEAVARTPIMGFREDVSIRVTPDGEDSRVDIRSASRYFESDLGSNAARVLKLIDTLEENEDIQTVTANYDMPDAVLQAALAE